MIKILPKLNLPSVYSKVQTTVTEPVLGLSTTAAMTSLFYSLLLAFSQTVPLC
jgi:hypothetical protein